MIQQALQKIQKEVGENTKNKLFAYVGAELIRYVRANPEKANLFAAEGKSIKGGFDAMAKAALKIKVGNMAAFSPGEGMAIVLEYYGIKQEPAAPEPVAIGLNVNVDDLL